MKKNLQTLYLRIDSSSKSLTKKALSQFLLKIIYFFVKPSTKEQVASVLTGILGTSISIKRINDAFELLLKDGMISELHGNYSISQTKKDKIDIAMEEFLNRQNRIIEKYFGPISTSSNFVNQWFEDVTVEFFNEYSSEWISDLCLTTNSAIKNKRRGIQVILNSVTDANKNILEKDKDWLKMQYVNFLKSNDNDVSSILWDYGTSRFASSLIIANTSVDPITIEEFTNSKCILDTNILMYLDLEKSKFKDAFLSMENIFINLKISPVYFFITRDEFAGAMDKKKYDIINVIEKYSQEVVNVTDDPFLQTALHRGCLTVEDFEQFFDQLMDIPKIFADLLDINMQDNVELDSAITNGQKDEILKTTINTIYKNKWHRDKSRNPLLHDAGLISGAKFIRKKEKCFILSRDSSINEATVPVKNQMPIAIGLNTLINLLAIDNGGTDIDPTNCAPLFANLIKLALVPERDVFKLEDLSRILDVETQIANLPSDQVIDIAKELHHNNVIGVSEEESSLQLNRRFQSAKIEWQSDLDKQKRETYFERDEKEKYIKRSDTAMQKLREKYIVEIRDKYDSQLFWNRILFFTIFPIITLSIIGAIIYSHSDSTTLWISELINLGIHILAWFILDFFFVDKRLRSKYSERVNDIANEVERKIRDDLQIE